MTIFYMKISSFYFSKIILFRYFFVGVLSLTTGRMLAQQNASGSNMFRASFVKIEITPETPKMLLGYQERKSTGVHDRIYHRIIALDDGVTQFFLVSSEICLVSPAEYDHIASLLERRLGINPVNFWWTCTHTHSAPEVGGPGLGAAFMGDRYKHEPDTAYTSFIQQTIINGIIEAKQKLLPAKVGVGWGFSQANINRRAIDVDGKASLGLNPDGPVDRRIGLLKIDKSDGSPLALITNYPMHGTVLGDSSMKISGDAPGVVSQYVENKTGATVLFINGAAGNLAPIYSVYSSPEEGHLSQFRVLLGDKILEANKKILSTSDSVKLFTGTLTVESPRKINLSWPSDLEKYSNTTKNGINMVRLPVRFLKINNDVAIWSAPLELFCEISNEVRDRSPFPFTFYYGYTNGWLGYLPSAEEWEHGGYEVEVVSPFMQEMSGVLKEAVVGYLQGEMRNTSADRSKAKKKR